ncbi:DUF4957 domain-containing protein [Parasediminibacterium sp. JCM 36343]|uniref:DUF4957 domain-containing protein n=1 Tax=Parasediminibacterium sp. JCM 36343 TaxID=3374279 RepID=UPI00397D3FF9
MKNINSWIHTLVIATVIGFISVSCHKSMEGGVLDSSTSRSFTPTGLAIKTSRDTATITFSAPLFAATGISYTVDIAKDSSFSTIEYSVVTKKTSVVITDANIQLITPYYARVSANPYQSFAASRYLVKGTFKLLGLQYLKVIRDFEITSNSVLVHWYLNNNTNGATNFVLTTSGGSAPINAPVAANEVSAGAKIITGLAAGKKYNIQLFAGTKSLGTATITTPPIVNFATILNAGVDDLAAAIAAASDGDVIGLNPGTYSLTSITPITKKTISIRSVSNNPTDTKILCRELDIAGDGAGLTLAGLEMSGNYGGTSLGVACLQLIGSPTSATPSAFTNVKIDNCIIHDYARYVLRGNAAATANDFKIGIISINNSQIYNIDQTSTTGYYTFALERLQFDAFSLTKSTLYSSGNGMINVNATLSTTAALPNITIDYCTVNNIGGSNRYLLFDAGANNIKYSLTNSILANTPINASVNTKASKGGGASILSFSYNNTFKFTSTPNGLDLVLISYTQDNNITQDLGWQPSTTNFSLSMLPSSNPVFSSSSTAGTLGDPRWAY